MQGHLPKLFENEALRVLRFAFLALALTASVVFSDLASAQEPEIDNSPASTSSIKAGTSWNSNPMTTSNPLSSNKLQYDFLAGFGGNFYGDEKQQEQSAAALLYTKVDYKPISFAEFDLFAGLNLLTGHSQYRYGDSEPHSGFMFKEAAVRLSPFDHFKIAIGALYVQDEPIPSLLISDFSFPGVSEEVQFGTTHQHIQFFAEQMIPTSSSLSTQTADQEQTPGFYAEGIDLRSPLFSRDLIAGLYAGHFKFSTLPGAVASQSALFGNTVHETGPNSSQFEYGFEGFFGGSELEWLMSRHLKIMVGEHVISNRDAPQDSRYGEMTQLKIQYRVNNDLIITPIFESFMNESDSSPAFFNSAEYGHNNMQGFGGHLRIDFPMEHFYARADYYSADLINVNPSQYNQQFFFLRFVTEYGNTKLFD